MAKPDFQLKGTRQFMQNLNREVDQLERRTHKGLIEAGIILMREAEPGTPVDIGNLRASQYIISIIGGEEGGSFKGEVASQMSDEHRKVISQAKQEAKLARHPLVLFGYTANYAVIVHEMLDANFKRPSAHARWLYKAMQKSHDKMLEAIAKEASF